MSCLRMLHCGNPQANQKKNGNKNAEMLLLSCFASFWLVCKQKMCVCVFLKGILPNLLGKNSTLGGALVLHVFAQNIPST